MPINPPDSDKPQPPQKHVLEIAAGYATPILIALTGFLYLAGSNLRNNYLDTFGISSDLFVSPIQDTISTGAFSTLMGIGAFILFRVMFQFLEKTFPQRLNPRVERYLAERRLRMSSIIVDMIFSAMMIGTFSVLIGYWMGGAKAELIRAQVRNGCSGCLVYRTNSERVTGYLIAQNGQQTAIYTPEGLRLMSTADIIGVTQYPSPAPASSTRSGPHGNAVSPAPQPSSPSPPPVVAPSSR